MKLELKQIAPYLPYDLKIYMKNETVEFVSAKPYLNTSNEEFMKIFFCLHGRKEVVVLCSDELKITLENLPSDYIQPRLIDIKKYLDEIGVKYTENFKNTTKL